LRKRQKQKEKKADWIKKDKNKRNNKKNPRENQERHEISKIKTENRTTKKERLKFT